MRYAFQLEQRKLVANASQMSTRTEANEDGNGAQQTMTEATGNTANADASAAPYAENLSIETATADVQRALEDYPDEYPYNYHFHPAVNQPIVSFDPTIVQDDFDPFNIGDFVNFDI